jgi:hypothetical protein
VALHLSKITYGLWAVEIRGRRGKHTILQLSNNITYSLWAKGGRGQHTVLKLSDEITYSL